MDGAKKNVTMTMTKQAFDFIYGEINAVHDFMDTAAVPREFNGAVLSMSQRVQWYVRTREAADAALTKAAGNRTAH